MRAGGGVGEADERVGAVAGQALRQPQRVEPEVLEGVDELAEAAAVERRRAGAEAVADSDLHEVTRVRTSNCLATGGTAMATATAGLERAIGVTKGVLAGVHADQLDDPTPCKSWKVRDLIDHIVGAHYFFAGHMNGAPPDDTGEAPDFAGGDYRGTFDAASKETVAAFNAPGAMEKTVNLPFGQFDGATFIGLATTDTFTHAWDLAKATGQPTDLDPELAAQVLENVGAGIGPGFRGEEPLPFGPEQQAPAGSSTADQLAAFLGRTV